MKPKTGSLAGESVPVSGRADVLAREPAAQDVNANSIPCTESPHVLVAGDFWPVLSQDGSSVGVALDLPDDAHSGSLKPEIDPADTGEEASDIHHHPLLECVFLFAASKGLAGLLVILKAIQTQTNPKARRPNANQA